MCRLAYFPPHVSITQSDMIAHMNRLEKSNGGDGNGYAAISPDGAVVINKGLNLTNNQIAKTIYPLLQQGWACFYHTRITSVGWNCDEQCHPFQIKGKSFEGSLCHNGTWYDGSVLAKYLQTGSDTATFAHLIGKLGLKEIKRRELLPKSGVFMIYGAKPGESPRPMVMYQAGDLEYCPKTGVWASEFFSDWPFFDHTYDVETGYHMLNKQPPKSKIIRRSNSYTYNYNNYRSTNKGKSQTSTETSPGTLTSVSDRQIASVDRYWPRTDPHNSYEEMDPVEAMGLCDEWENRQYYHQRTEDL